MILLRMIMLVMLRFQTFRKNSMKNSSYLGGMLIQQKELEVGDFIVWSQRTKKGVKEYFWKDTDSPQGFGPFTSSEKAVKSYEIIMNMMSKPAGTVVGVDFKKKTRV